MKTYLKTLLLFAALSQNLISQNQNLTNLAVFEGEPYLAINPTNPKNMVVAWMGYVFGNGSGLTIKVKNTFNGGLSWSSSLNLPHIKSTYKSADVNMAFDLTGKLHLNYIDYRESPDSGGVYYCNSVNGGTSFSAPVKVIDAYADGSKRPLDRPWMSVNSSGTRIFITTKPAPWIPAPNRAYLTSSSDDGATWSNYRYIDTTNFLIGPSIAAPMAFPSYAGNTLRIMYPSFVPSQNLLPAFYLASSTNNGGTFNYTTMLALNTSAAANDSAKSAYQLITNPSNTLNCVAIMNVGISSTDLDVYMIESTNGGTTWGAPVRINNDAMNNGKMQDLVWGTFDQSGNLAITWRDRRNAPGVGYARASEIYGAYRPSGSSAFQPNFKISDALETYGNVLSQNGNDFMSAVLHNDTLHAVWGSTRDGSLDIWYSKLKAGSGTTGITKLLASESFVLDTYPNPFTDQLSISLTNKSSIKSIQLTTLEGKEVYFEKLNVNKTIISLKFFNSGVYILNVKDEQGNLHSKKIIR
ncbi:MAG: T9SS type A sorting domain-containing protein [Bacteroidota bacterium]